jgi:HEAT repeat protein
MDFSVTIAVLVGCVIVLGVGIMSSVLRKARRDRREAQQGDRRRRFAEGLHSAAGWAQILPELVGSPEAQRDLAAVLDTRETRVAVTTLAEYPPAGSDLRSRLTSREPTQRGIAVLLLNLLDDEEGVSAAVGAMSDRDADVRLVAARALGMDRTDRSAEALVLALREHLLPDPRLIERLDGPWALPTCLQAAHETTADATNSRFRVGLIKALGLIGDAAATPTLLELVGDSDPEVRVNAARALGTCATPSELVADALILALHDDHPPVRMQAAKSLGLLRCTRAVQELQHAMSDRSWWVRNNAAAALAQCGDAGLAALEHVARGPDRFAGQRAREQLTLWGTR